MKSASISAVATASLAVLLSGAQAQVTVTDDFNDGNDVGWVRYDPIGVGTYDFPAGGYRIQASASPNPMLGDARAASFRADASYSAFRVSADVVDFDITLLQAFGTAARVATPGLGTTDGYIFVYDNDADEMVIARLDNEVPTTIGSTSLSLDDTEDYRFVFSGSGSNFVGEVFNLTTGGGLFGSVTAVDSTYASGISGLLVAALDVVEEGDATFDNFVAVPEPVSSIMLVGAGGMLALARRRRFSV